MNYLTKQSIFLHFSVILLFFQFYRIDTVFYQIGIFFFYSTEKGTRDKFNELITVSLPDADSELGDLGANAQPLMLVSESDLAKHNDKTKFYMRISEIVQENSGQVLISKIRFNGESSKNMYFFAIANHCLATWNCRCKIVL